MSITDELRKWGYGFCGDTHDVVTAIADRIDEQRENDALGEYTRGYNAGFNAASDGCESADELRERIEREYVKMPVDADGKVIHVEDEVELLDGSKRFKVEWLEWDGEDWAVHETIGYGAYHEPSSLRHVKPDSWERIIHDATGAGWMGESVFDEKDFERIEAELVERCKRLAGVE